MECSTTVSQQSASREARLRPHANPSMMRLTKLGAIFSGSPKDVESLRRQFDREHCILLPQLVDPELLLVVRALIDGAEFRSESYDRVGSELHMEANPAWDLLHFLANDPKLLRFVERATACGRIGCFAGRVYRMLPGPGHSFVWHDDRVESRLLAMSVNLSTEVFAGGVLEIRESESKRIVYRAGRLDWGDALIFRIADSLQHRVTPLQGTVPKTAFAGWFQSEPDFHAVLRKREAAQKEPDAGVPSGPADLSVVQRR